MDLADYKRVVLGHRLRELQHAREHRSILGYSAGIDPKKIYELPGDYDHVPDPMSQEEMIAQARELGYAHLLGIKPEC